MDNSTMKKLIQRIINLILQNKKYKQLNFVEVFFVFGSSRKTAMCDWVYGLKINSDLGLGFRSEIVLELQKDLKNKLEKIVNQSTCCTDVIFEKS